MATNDGEDFLVRSQKEILALLKGIKNSHALVTAYFDHGNESIVTAILAVLEDRDALIMDYGTNERLNQKLLASEKVIFHTSHNRVQVKFSANALRRVHYDKMDAFIMDIPDSMQRIQRREYYRIDTPIVEPIRFIADIAEDENGKRVDFGRLAFVDATIVNISIGGVGIVDFPSGVKIEKEVVLRGCHIELPGVGVLEVDMKVVNTYEIPSKDGTRVTHYGCQFIDLNGGMQSMIQRYILQLERERRAKSL